MRKLKYLLFILPFCFYFNVFAQDYNVTSSITSPSSGSSNAFSATEILYSGTGNISYNFNTRYQGQLSRIRFNIPIPNNWIDGDCFSTGDLTYTLTLNMATNDWRNHFSRPFVSSSSAGTNWATSNIIFVSRKQIKFNFKIPSSSTCYDFLYVNLVSTDEQDVAFTGETNFNLSSVILSTNSSGGSSTPSGPSTTFDDTAIINNANKNTQDIIDNNSTNTQDIINNSNDNTQQIIDNQNQLLGSKCSNLIDIPDLSLNKDNNRTYDYILPNILPSGTYTLSYNYSASGNPTTYIQILLQSTTGTLLELTLNSTGKNIFTINSSFNRFYILISSNSASGSSVNLSNLMLVSGGTAIPFCKYGSTLSKIDETTNAINSSRDDIINNQNQNTQQQIDSQYVCKNYDKNYKKTIGYLSSSGSVVSNSSGNYFISDFIPIYSTSKIKLTTSSESALHTCFYSSNLTRISCFRQSDYELNTEIPIPDNASYIKFSMNISTNRPVYSICNTGNQGIQDSITDSNVDSDVGNGFFDNFNNNMHGLSSIITIPLSSIQSLSSSTCSPLHFPIPFTDNKYLDVPCMTEIYEQHVPTLLTLIQTCWYGILAYKVLVNIFGIVKGFKDPDSDKIEVMDL